MYMKISMDYMQTVCLGTKLLSHKIRAISLPQ